VLSHQLWEHLVDSETRGFTRMEMNLFSWNTHCWMSRRLALAPGHPLIQRVCNDCERAFVDECSTGERYAVHVSIFKVHRLSDEVTSRWLSEQCPAQPLAGDEADRRTRFIPKAEAYAMPASPATTANALNAVRSAVYAKNGTLGQNAPPQPGNANAFSSKTRQMPV
jgi:hypothetical protein